MDFAVETLLFLFFAAVVAGFMDTLAGGGGLITIPALVVSGVPPLAALGVKNQHLVVNGVFRATGPADPVAQSMQRRALINADGEMFTRPGTLADHFSGPYANREAAMAANGGAYPPDFSLLAKARGVERGFPLFVFDIFTQYQEGGVDYIYNLLIRYSDDVPANVEVQDGLYYNPYFVSGAALAMAPPLSDDVVTYDDGTPATVDQMSRDVAAFMMWAAEPKLEARKQMGFRVMIFLLIFAALLYIAKKQVYSRIEH